MLAAWLVAAALAADPVAGRVFLPVDGDAPQLHPQGRLATHPQRVRWIPMWTQADPAADVHLVATPPVALAPGRARVLVEVRHRVPWGDALVRVRVRAGDTMLLLDRTVTARPYADPHDGGLQPIDLKFDVPVGSPALVVEVDSATTHRLWVGAVALTSAAPRPLWVVRHCANTRPALLRAVAQGASGVELDVMWHDEPVIGHPAPSPPGCPVALPQRGQALDMLVHAVGRSLREGAISLVILDVKHPEADTATQARAWVDLLAHAGIDRAHVVWSVDVRVARRWTEAVASAAGDGEVPHVDAWHDAARHALAPDWIAQSVEAGSDFLGLGADPFVSWMPMPQWIAPLADAVNRRDDGTGPAHVYAWTLARPASMRLVLDLGVDAVIVNDPRRLLRELATPPHDGRFQRP